MILIRSLLFYGLATVATILMGLFSFILRLFLRKNKNLILAYSQLWARSILFLLKKTCHISVHVSGREHLPADSSFLIASKHQSAFDALIWMSLLPRPAYIMKKELLKIPFVGPMLSLSGMIPIDRKSGSKALKLLLKSCQNAIEDLRQIIIFPEGTRTNIGENTKIHSGVIAIAKTLQLKVVPVNTDSGLYWPSRSFLKHPGVIHIQIFPAITDIQDRKATLSTIEQCWSKIESIKHTCG